MYQFETQFDKGAAVESLVFSALERNGWQVTPSIFSQTQKTGQRLGFDAIIQKPPHQLTIEIKADYAAEKTGNLFIETVSVDKYNTPGWAYSSQAQILVTVLPIQRCIILSSMGWLRGKLEEWESRCRKRKCHNKNPDWHGEFNSEGLLVPIAEFYREAAGDRGNVRILGSYL